VIFHSYVSLPEGNHYFIAKSIPKKPLAPSGWELPHLRQAGTKKTHTKQPRRNLDNLPGPPGRQWFGCQTAPKNTTKKFTTSTYHIAQDRSLLNSIGRCYPNKNFKWSENSIYNELQFLMPSDYWKMGLSPEHLGVWLPFVAFTGLVGLKIRTELPLFSSMVHHISLEKTTWMFFKFRKNNLGFIHISSIFT
jgi:hypothetical protein